MNYLYNGIELPALQLSNYRYAVIVGGAHAFTFKKFWNVYFTDKPLVDVIGVLCATDVYYDQYICYEADIEGGVWTLQKENAFATFNLTNGPATGTKVWSNYDIMSDDGTTVVFSASDPIPVTTPTIDPASMLMGWLTGRRIAAQWRRRDEQTWETLFDGTASNLNAPGTNIAYYTKLLTQNTDEQGITMREGDTIKLTVNGVAKTYTAFLTPGNAYTPEDHAAVGNPVMAYYTYQTPDYEDNGDDYCVHGQWGNFYFVAKAQGDYAIKIERMTSTTTSAKETTT